MWFVTFVGKNLWRRRARSSLTIVGVALAIAAAVALVGVATGFEQSYLDVYTRRGVDLVVQRSGRNEQLNSGLDESLGKRIRAIPGVKDVIGGIVDVVSFEQYELLWVLVNGWADDVALFDQLELFSGRRLHPGDRGEVMLGHVLAANLGKHVGETIELYGQEFKVVGVYESYNVYDNDAVIMLLDELQALTDRPHQVTGFTVTADRAAGNFDMAGLQTRIEALQPGISALPTAEFIANVNQIKMARATSWVTSTIALVLGAIGVLNTMIMSVYERRREIGVLRAIGWRQLRVVRMVLAESLLLTLGGAVVGSLAGVAFTRLLSHLPITSGVVQGTIAPRVIVQGFAIALAMGIGGAAYPAYWSTRLRPVEALRAK
ncbi:MAG TPA: ABC transporter permease [Pirellulales bacterium]|jgi:putative ABC transport system permease protein|nr:ABC transporter permease [Pirellulales bacterium]